MFKREPPEGCERVKVFTEETQSVLLPIPSLSSFSLFPTFVFGSFCICWALKWWLCMALIVSSLLTQRFWLIFLILTVFSLSSVCVHATQGQTSAWDPAVPVPRQKQGQLHPQQRLSVLPGQHSQTAQSERPHWGRTESVPRHQHPVPVAFLLFLVLILPHTTCRRHRELDMQSINQSSFLAILSPPLPN